MGKLKKVGIGIGVIFLILIILGIIGSTFNTTNSGTTSQSSTTQTSSQSSSIPTATTSTTISTTMNIQMFEGVKEGDLVRFYFVFDDGRAYDGIVSFNILDNTNRTLYTNQFDVNSNQYVDYEYKLTGKPIGKAYEWKIPFNEIQKGMSNIGTAHMKFTTEDGRTLNADTTLLEIPSYTPDEIKQLYEAKYLQSSKTIGKTMSEGNFEVTLVRVGYFTHLQYDTWGDEVTDFRADIKVKNIVTESESFNSYDAAMIVGSTQYSYSYDSEFDGSNIYPDIIKEGYLLFKDVPKGLNGQIKIIAGSSYYMPEDIHSWENVLYTFTIQI